ncbi:DJ-1/PfpI family protein [Streptomyces sp. NPDC096191]|uniref:DJ-1/PfpI family protein n=1 Tax=Streptomyces sp. NPDC096191 TaxID=3155426 RepID=UPI00332E68EF
MKAFAASGRPLAANCRGPWALVEADVLRGKTLIAYPSLRTDVTNAGAKALEAVTMVLLAPSTRAASLARPNHP